MGIANLESVGTTNRVSILSIASHGDIHDFHSITVQRKYGLFKSALLQYLNNPMVVDGNDDPADDDSDVDMPLAVDMDDDLPLRAEPELVIDYPTDKLEKSIATFVTAAVREVGWVPRDVYHFMQNPASFSMFSMLNVV